MLRAFEQCRRVFKVVKRGNGSSRFMLTCEATCPLNRHRESLGVINHFDRDALDQNAHEVLAVYAEAVRTVKKDNTFNRTMKR